MRALLSSSVVNVGVIIDEDYLSNIEDFFNRAVSKIESKSGSNSYSINPKIDPQRRGCGTGEDRFDGAYLATEFYFNDNVTAFFGPVCNDDLQIVSGLSAAWNILQFNFWRDYSLDLDAAFIIQMSTQSATNMAVNLASVLLLFNFKNIGIVKCPNCYPDPQNMRSSFETMKRILAQRDITILIDLEVDSETAADPERLSAILKKLETSARIIVPFFGTTLDDYSTFMKATNLARFSKTEYVFIISLGHYSFESLSLPWETDPEELGLFDKAIILHNEYYNSSFVTSFMSDDMATPVDNPAKLLVYTQLYESIELYLTYLNMAYSMSSNVTAYRNSTYLLDLIRNGEIDGTFGKMNLDSFSQRVAPFQCYLVSAENQRMIPFLDINISNVCGTSGIQEYEGKCTSLYASLVNPTIEFATRMPPDIPNCGFHGEMCDQKGTIVIVVAVMGAVSIAVTIFLCARKMRSGETASMPWAVPSSIIRFVDNDYKGSSDFQSMSIHSLQGNEGKTKIQEHHQRRLMGSINQQIAIIEVFQLREKLVFDKKDMQLLFTIKQAVHDNINAFIGVSMDMSHELFVIWRHAIRGTLADIIFRSKDDDDRQNTLNQNFTGAFVRDIIKGLDFLHSSPISFHGSLTTSNCFIDSHWILKLSGFGINRLLYKWRISAMIAGKDGGPIIPDSELHYYAPNLRSRISRAVAQNKISELELNSGEGQANDMYSFGIILYEILYKKRAHEFTEPVQTRQYYDDGFDGADDLDVGIASEAAMAQLPTYPSVPDDPEVHPDLVSLMHKCFHGIWQNRPDANMARKITDATLKMPGSLVDQMIKNMEQYNNNLENLVKQRTGQLEEAQRRSEEILLELLPKSVADELKLGRTVPPKNYKVATVMYSDIVGFTSLCSESQPMEVVTLLSGVFKAFDSIIGEHKAYKVETIGDAYMVASGVPEKIEKKHVKEISMIALKQREFLYEYTIPHRPGEHLHCRWGFNTGPVFTGVVGITAPRYCVFGATVTVAAKMENSGMPDRIQMTVYSQKILADCFPEFKCTKRDQTVRVNSLGNYLTYWLDGYEELLSSFRGGKQPDVIGNE